MKNLLRYLSIFSTFAFILACCQSNSCRSTEKSGPKGGGVQMETFHLGRFSIGVPFGMTLRGQLIRLRSTELTEILRDSGRSQDQHRESIWAARIAEIKKMRVAYDETTPILEQRRFDGLGLWAKGILYKQNWASEEAVWEILVDYGPTAVWFLADGAIMEKENMEKVLRNLRDIASSYRPRATAVPFGAGNWFHLANGAIKSSYQWDEQATATYVGHPLELELQIEMNDTYRDEPKDEGLFARTAAAIVTGFAAGVKIKPIRSRHRVVAGIKGEEQVVRMTSTDATEFDFTWRYPGKKDSGEYPQITISMESPHGQIDEKLKIWDAILDSMKPLYRTTP